MICCAVSALLLERGRRPEGGPESRAGGGKGKVRDPARPFFPPARFGEADAGGGFWKKNGQFPPSRMALRQIAGRHKRAQPLAAAPPVIRTGAPCYSYGAPCYSHGQPCYSNSTAFFSELLFFFEKIGLNFENLTKKCDNFNVQLWLKY